MAISTSTQGRIEDLKISLLEPLNVDDRIIEEYKKQIEDLGYDFVYYKGKTTDVEELIERSQGSEMVMIANNPYPGEVIKATDKLEYLNVAFTGVDHVDLGALKDKGARLSNASGYSDPAVAELVIGLILDLYREISLKNEEVRSQGLASLGREIKGKTVGIVGTGNIGTETARLLKAFGAEVLGYDQDEKEAFKDLGGTYTSLHELLKESDIVSLHLPVTEATTHFIGKEELGLMKEDAILINCARGKVIDNDALAEALNQGEIAGAGVDVFDMEPPIPEDYPLLKAKNTILTPHLAFFTRESMERRAHIAFDNTLAYLKGEIKNEIKL